MVKNHKKKPEINLPNSSDEEENDYLPLKYPSTGKLTQEKIKNFCGKITSEDKNNAGTSKSSSFCGHCDTIIKLNQTAIQCKGDCQNWFHLKCTTLDLKDIEFFSKELKKSKGKRWNCSNCAEECKNQGLQFSQIVEDLMKTVKELQLSIEFMSNKYEEVKKENREFFNILKQLKKEREEIILENLNLKNEVTAVKNELISLKRTIDEEEQMKLKNVIEIKGVIQQKNIGDEEIVGTIFNKIGLQFQKEDIQKIIRKKRNKDKPVEAVEVILKNEEIKEKIIRYSKNYYKTQGMLTSTEIGLGEKTSVIYINEAMNSANRYLFGKSRELRNFGYKFVWFKNGKNFVRKNENDVPKIIRFQNEIDELKKMK